MNPLIASILIISMTGCTSLNYSETSAGDVELSYISTREVTNLKAKKSLKEVSVEVGKASGLSEFTELADIIAERIVDKIPASVPITPP